MDPVYDAAQIEADAQAWWERNRSFEVDEDPGREKFYCLSMFPYPSGALHVGHVRNYTIGDVIARYQRMQGKNVLQPIGWDAFGLPAENAAIQNRIPPAKWTYANIEKMRRQFRRLGFAYDWRRELATCRPEYYRWEQWLFTRLMGKGLAYKKSAVVNWDPVDQTVLANEQVIDGRGWRSGAPVERREIPQWFLKITDYADELLEHLDGLEGWPEAVRTMQRNWIGRSEGLELEFALEGRDETLRIYTTRPDTLMGATYMAVAAEHPLARQAAETDEAVAAFVAECRHGMVSEAAMETMEKKGMRLPVAAIHPVSREPLPVLVANFVLMEYGTGAVMAVPGHDQRDWEFARRYSLPIRQVVTPADGSEADLAQSAFTDHGVLVNSGEFDGLDFREAFDAIAGWAERHGVGRRRVNYRLRDWLVSRQRYWGAPVPVVDTGDGVVPVAEDELPVVLPEDVEFSGAGSPLREMPGFLETTYEGRPAQRETDTFDTFVESSWYYARYCCWDNDEAMLDDRARYWLPVDQYVGGIEHAILHLLYVRFFHKLMREEGLVEGDEPVVNLLTQGMVNAQTYYRESTGKREYFSADEVEVQTDDKGRAVAARLIADGDPVVIGPVEKMSKSKRNGVDPERLLSGYGADTLRLFAMSDAPPDQSLEWSERGVAGAHRFLKRLWRVVREHVGGGPVAALAPAALDEAQGELRSHTHRTIAKVGDDVGRRYTFNTAIAAIRELINHVVEFEDRSAQGRAVVHEALCAAVAMLAPITPHLCHRLWLDLGHDTAVIDAPWPRADAAAQRTATQEIVVQVNGKLRGRVTVAAGADRATVEQAALTDANVRRFVADRTVRKVIVVPGKLVNVVV